MREGGQTLTKQTVARLRGARICGLHPRCVKNQLTLLGAWHSVAQREIQVATCLHSLPPDAADSEPQKTPVRAGEGRELLGGHGDYGMVSILNKDWLILFLSWGNRKWFSHVSLHQN